MRKKNIIANPNCSNPQMVWGAQAAALTRAIKRVVVSTYQVGCPVPVRKASTSCWIRPSHLQPDR